MKIVKQLHSIFLFIVLAVCAVNPATAERTTTYFHSDGVGSIVAASDENGDLLWRKQYQPFGTQVDDSNISEPTSFTGKQHDDTTGLTYFGARYYDPMLGRFVSTDPVSPLGGSGNSPYFFNRYAYAYNNPYLYVDPDGRHPVYYGVKLVLTAVATVLSAPKTANAPDEGEETVTDSDAELVMDSIPGGRLVNAAKKTTKNAVESTVKKKVGNSATKGGSVGAMRRNTFEASPKHGTSARNTSKGVASRGPLDGQHALDNSVQVKGTSTRRVGVDKANGEIVVFDQTSSGIFHGHVRSFKDLTSQQQNALRKSGLVNKKGDIK